LLITWQKENKIKTFPLVSKRKEKKMGTFPHGPEPGGAAIETEKAVPERNR
jgi:hypothetical protein